MQRMRELLVVSTAIALLMTVFAGVALADKPVVMDRFVEEISGPNEEVAAFCGLSEVHSSGVIKGTLKMYEDGTVREHAVGSIEYYGPQGEGPVVLSFSRNFSGLGGPVSEVFDPGTGLLTLEFEDEAFTGRVEQWRAPGIGVIDMDSGSISWTVTIVVDTNTGQIVSEEFTDVVAHGKFPIFENGFLPPSAQLMCELLGA